MTLEAQPSLIDIGGENLGTISVRVVVLPRKAEAQDMIADTDEPSDLSPDEILSEVGPSPIGSYLERPKTGKLCCVFLVNGQRQEGLDNSFIVQQRRTIEVVVVIVAYEHDRDWRERVEWNGRKPDAPRSEHVPRPGVFGIHRVGQDISGGRLNEEGRVADEGHHRGCATVERRHDSRFVLDARRPRRPAFQQHPWHGGQRLQAWTRRVEEAAAVEMTLPRAQ